jgi:hypothetical protein
VSPAMAVSSLSAGSGTQSGEVVGSSQVREDSWIGIPWAFLVAIGGRGQMDFGTK